jgi:single-strand DNA-binding protein
MMAADNQTTIAGNLVDTPELRFTNTGTPVTNLRVAVTQRLQHDGEWRDGDTSFFNVNVWRGQAEHLAESLSKGDRVMVTGRLRQRSWETPEGEKRSVAEIEADEVGASLNADNLGWFGWLGVVRVVVGASRWSPAGAADGCRLGGPDNHDRLDSRQRRLQPGLVVGALDAEAGHLALDHPREGPQPPDGQQLLGHLAGHPGQGPGRWLRGERPPGRWW